MKLKLRLFGLLSLGLALCLAPLRAETNLPPLKLAEKVDLQSIFGEWYIVANIPNSFENKFVGLHVHFSLREDGDIQDNFTAHPHDFQHPEKTYRTRDTIIPGTGNASWRVHILWPFIAVPFQILYVDPADQFILFGYPDRTMGWIFSRKPTISKSTYDFAMKTFSEQGYDTTKFRHLTQTPDQIGQRGFSFPSSD